jgi:hypothetical protein
MDGLSCQWVRELQIATLQEQSLQPARPNPMVELGIGVERVAQNRKMMERQMSPDLVLPSGKNLYL